MYCSQNVAINVRITGNVTINAVEPIMLLNQQELSTKYFVPTASIYHPMATFQFEAPYDIPPLS